MRDITTKLLRFARQDAGSDGAFDLGEHVAEIATLFEHQAASAGGRIEHDFDGAGPLVVSGDPAEWRQVFFNLLRNALDVSPRGAAIRVRGARRGAHVEVVVEDQGPGISKDRHELVFEPFQTTKGPGKGTGLGLAIVHRIVTAHGGSVRIEHAGPGARLVITVPAAGR